MKSDVFNQYVERVTDLFGIDKKDFFTKSKRRDYVDARYLVYYLCSTRPMQTKYIERYMEENGYKTQHSSVIHGIKIISDKIKDDKDYRTIINDIDKSVFI